MLVCFSHLRWDFVWQRSQHLLSRFARTMPGYRIAEPGSGHRQPGPRVAGHDGVTVVTPRPTARSRGFSPESNRAIQGLITPFSGKRVSNKKAPILWRLTPMACGIHPLWLEPASQPIVADSAWDADSRRMMALMAKTIEPRRSTISIARDRVSRADGGATATGPAGRFGWSRPHHRENRDVALPAMTAALPASVVH